MSHPYYSYSVTDCVSIATMIPLEYVSINLRQTEKKNKGEWERERGRLDALNCVSSKYDKIKLSDAFIKNKLIPMWWHI
jgi:hypothetical protein